MPKKLEIKAKKDYGSSKVNKDHHTGKGTRSRLDTAASKMFFGTKRSK